MKKNLMYIILAFVFCLTIGVCIYKSMLEEMGSKDSRQSLERERATSYIGCVKKIFGNAKVGRIRVGR